MFITPAFAQTAAPAGASTFATIVQWAPILLMAAVFYFLLIMPQQKQQKKLKAQLAALKRGDKVVTSGGIIGTVKKAAEGAAEIEIEIAPNVTVSVVRSTVSSVVTDKA
ncbi:MAG TPA: preprotein translocase subunit YajC [Acidocella sp.]|nr:preprotein translocase subunit YajC [Acidocella sp.]